MIKLIKVHSKTFLVPDKRSLFFSNMTTTKIETNLDFHFNNFLANQFKKNLCYIKIACFLYCTVQFAVNLMYRNNYALVAIWAVLALVSLLALGKVVRFSERKQPQTPRRALLQHIEEKCFVIIYAGLGFYFFKTLFESNSEATPYIDFISGFDIVIVLFLFQMVNMRWHSVALAVSALMVALIINTWAKNTGSYSISQQIEITLRLLVAPIYVTIFTVVLEGNSKELFSLKMQLEESKATLKEIMDFVPESILVMSSDIQRQYCNEGFKKLVTQTGETIENMDAFFSKFYNLSKVLSTRTKLNYDLQIPNAPTELKMVLTRFVRKMEEGQWESDEGLSTLTNQGLDPKQHPVPVVYKGNYIKHGGALQTLSDEEGEDHEQIKGRERSVVIKLVPFRYQGDNAILMITRHAPEIKYLEELDKAAKYKDEILASVSHELRTPINSNMNLINEALKSQEIPQPIKDNLLDPAFKSGKLLLSLVNDILDISQIKEGKLKLVSQVCEIRKVIQECHYLFEQQCKQKKLDLTLKIDKRIPLKIRTDPNRLTQVVLNLLSNAYKFTLEGSITIDMSLDFGGLIKISVIDTGIGIKEDDIGKLMKRFEKIDLGDNARVNSMGAGLGLSIANSLAVMLGPKEGQLAGLKFASEWGKGTTASFLLKSRKKFNFNPYVSIVQTQRTESPVVRYLKDVNASSDGVTNRLDSVNEELDSSGYLEEENLPSSMYNFNKRDTRLDLLHSKISNSLGSAETIQVPVGETRKKLASRRNVTCIGTHGCGCPPVLVVDDDAFNVLTMQTLLKSLDVPSEMAHSGVECIKKIQTATRCSKRCKRFSLILLDGNMPLKDGFTTARELIQWNSSIEMPWNMTIVGCTAYTEKQRWKEFLDAGAIEHVTKPLSKSDLEKVLKKCFII